MAFHPLSFVFLCLVAASNSQPTGKVRGGQDAKQGEFPYLISLRNTVAAPMCGGTLVVVNSTQVIITSADCLQSTPETVVAGDLKLTDVSGFEQFRVISIRVIHPDYDYPKNRYENNIGLIFLNRPFLINNNVAPIALPPSNHPNPSGNVLITGWGNSSNVFGLVDHLQKVVVPVLDQTACNASYEGVIPSYAFCLGAPGKGACDGDGGGPLILPDAKYLVAVSLDNFECGDPREPGVNTNVSPYVEWIEQEVAKHCEIYMC